MNQLEIAPNRRKIIVRRVIIAFFVLIVLLTLFSKTIDTFLLPQVTVGTPVKGSLQLNRKTAGKLELVNTEKVYSTGNWKIKDVPVMSNQVIQKGDVLATVDNDGVDMEIKRYELDILRLENNLNEYKSRKEEVYNRRINEKLLEIELKKLEYKEFKESIPRDGKILANVNGTVLSVNINPEMQVISGQVLFEIASDTTMYRVSWAVDQSDALFLEEGDKVTINLDGKVMPTENDKSSNKSSKSAAYKQIAHQAEISGKEYTPDLKSYKYWTDFNIENMKFQNGQQVEVMWNKSLSTGIQMLIPREAVFENADKAKCVYVLNEREGLLGKELYVKETKVTTVGNDDMYYAVEGSIHFGSQIVLNKSKPLSDNARVRLR